jgi:hypothetical protein
MTSFVVSLHLVNYRQANLITFIHQLAVTRCDDEVCCSSGSGEHDNGSTGVHGFSGSLQCIRSAFDHERYDRNVCEVFYEVGTTITIFSVTRNLAQMGSS